SYSREQALDDTEQATPREHDHDDEQHADSEVPVFRKLLCQPVLRDKVDDGPDERTVNSSDAAQYQHHEQLARSFEAEHVETHDLVGLRDEPAREAREARGERIYRDEAGIDGRTNGVHAPRIVPEASERSPERGIDKPANDIPASEENG